MTLLNYCLIISLTNTQKALRPYEEQQATVVFFVVVVSGGNYRRSASALPATPEIREIVLQTSK